MALIQTNSTDDGLAARLVARGTNRVARVRRLAVGGSRIHAWLLRVSGGRVLPRWFFGAPVLVVETIGRKTGRRRAVPVLYLHDGDRLVVVAANAGGAPPAWWLNLRDAGECTVLLGRRRIGMTARELLGDERRAIWPRLVATYPALAHYPRLAGRSLNVVALEPGAVKTV